MHGKKASGGRPRGLFTRGASGAGRARFWLFALLNLAAGVLLVVAIESYSPSTPDIRNIEELRLRLRARFGQARGLSDLRVGFRPGPRHGEPGVGVAFSVGGDAWRDRPAVESLMDAVCRRVVIDYPAHAASVEVFVHPPADMPEAQGIPSLRMRRSYAELVDALSESEVAELGAGRWAASSPSDRWRLVVIHHSATDSGSAAAFDRYHRDEKGWDGLGYHFVIGNGRGSADGLVEVGRRWRLQEDGSHAGVAEANRVGVGVCLVGDFGKTQPTAAQMASLRCLCRWLHAERRMPYSSIVGHRDIKATDCPGKGFPMAELIEELGRPAADPVGAASPEARQGHPTSEPSPR